MRAALAEPSVQFERGPRVLTRRGTADDDAPAFVVHRYLDLLRAPAGA